MSRSGSDIAFRNNLCECYKKLEFLDVPLYKNEEDEHYGEGLGEIPHESAFQLPGVLTVNAEVSQYPVVNDRNLPETFRQMAQVIPNLADFDLNVLSFWILDMFVEGLWTAQRAGMNHEHQRATLLWIAYLFNYIQKENPTRKDLFIHLKMVLFKIDQKRNEYSGEESRMEEMTESSSSLKEEPAEYNPPVDDMWELPLPPGTIDINTESEISSSEHLTVSEETSLSETNGEDGKITSTKTTEETVAERNVRHMKIILDILYRIFARLWVYLEIQAVFHAMPTVEQVDLPFKLNVPKPAPKVDPFAPPKPDRAGRKMTAIEESNPELEREKQLHKNDFILPLQAAEESKAMIKQLFGQLPSDRSIFSKGKDKKK